MFRSITAVLVCVKNLFVNEAVIVEKLNRTIIVKFNRPEIRSPLSIAVLEVLHRTIDEIKINEKIRTVIFTGAKDVFASGADLREIARVTGASAREFALRGQSLMNKIENLDQLTIAAINGFCFGGALDLALACGERIAAPNAQFSHPGASLGIMTGWGGTQRLPHLIGEAKALEMFLTTKRIDANEALRIGLIDEISDNPLRRCLSKTSK
jgi:enoyl-CoA hydratase